MTVEKIQAALFKLDVSNDNHWTAEGLPRLETLRLFAGDQGISREQVTQAAPQFSRVAATPVTAATTPAVPPTLTANPAANAPAAVTVQETTAVMPSGLPPVQDAGLPNQKTILVNPLAAVQPASKEDIAKLEEQLACINGDLAEIKVCETEIKKAKKEKQTIADDLILRIEKLRPRDSTPDAIQSYLARQQETRNNRAAQIGRARAFEAESGVKITDLLPKRAPIDQAMARNVGFGKKRPEA